MKNLCFAIFLALNLAGLLASCDGLIKDKEEPEPEPDTLLVNTPTLKLESIDQFKFKLGWEMEQDPEVSAFNISWEVLGHNGQSEGGMEESISPTQQSYEPKINSDNLTTNFTPICGKKIRCIIKAGKATRTKWFYSLPDTLYIEAPDCEYELLNEGVTNANLCEYPYFSGVKFKLINKTYNDMPYFFSSCHTSSEFECGEDEKFRYYIESSIKDVEANITGSSVSVNAPVQCDGNPDTGEITLKVYYEDKITGKPVLNSPATYHFKVN